MSLPSPRQTPIQAASGSSRVSRSQADVSPAVASSSAAAGSASARWPNFDDDEHAIKGENIAVREETRRLGVKLLDAVLEERDDMGNRLAWSFIDLPDKKEHPGYYQVNQTPTSLNMCKAKIIKGRTTSLDGIKNAIVHCFKASQNYNREDSKIWKTAELLVKFTNATYKALLPTKPRASWVYASSDDDSEEEESEEEEEADEPEQQPSPPEPSPRTRRPRSSRTDNRAAKVSAPEESESPPRRSSGRLKRHRPASRESSSASSADESAERTESTARDRGEGPSRRVGTRSSGRLQAQEDDEMEVDQDDDEAEPSPVRSSPRRRTRSSLKGSAPTSPTKSARPSPRRRSQRHARRESPSNSTYEAAGSDSDDNSAYDPKPVKAPKSPKWVVDDEDSEPLESSASGSSGDEDEDENDGPTKRKAGPSDHAARARVKAAERRKKALARLQMQRAGIKMNGDAVSESSEEIDEEEDAPMPPRSSPRKKLRLASVASDSSEVDESPTAKEKELTRLLEEARSELEASNTSYQQELQDLRAQMVQQDAEPEPEPADLEDAEPVAPVVFGDESETAQENIRLRLQLAEAQEEIASLKRFNEELLNKRETLRQGLAALAASSARSGSE